MGGSGSGVVISARGSVRPVAKSEAKEAPRHSQVRDDELGPRIARTGDERPNQILRHEKLRGEDVRLAFDRAGCASRGDVFSPAHHWVAAALKALAHPMTDFVGKREA